jgi:LacI family transcriptional regulator
VLKRLGYQRIGICFHEYTRGRVNIWNSSAYFFYSRVPKPARVPPLFYLAKPNEFSAARKQVSEWLTRYKPEVVVCHNNQMVEWVEAAGFRVPEEIGVVHLATDDDVRDWAGLTSNRRQMGALATELVVSFLNSRQFGVPSTARSTLIRGSWHPGRTLLIPKPE